MLPHCNDVPNGTTATTFQNPDESPRNDALWSSEYTKELMISLTPPFDSLLGPKVDDHTDTDDGLAVILAPLLVPDD
ncbi:unnamed protein product [Calypogeia fissa]